MESIAPDRFDIRTSFDITTDENGKQVVNLILA